MSSIDAQILRTTKEIVVKFIEVERAYPASFHETFTSVYHTVKGIAKGSGKAPGPEGGKKK